MEIFIKSKVKEIKLLPKANPDVKLLPRRKKVVRIWSLSERRLVEREI